MKTLYVATLEDGQAVTSLFLVREKEIRTSARTGSSWLQLELADRTGTISGAFSNGTNVALGQISLADFNNPGGLIRAGDNMYTVSGNSGIDPDEAARNWLRDNGFNHPIRS